MTIGLRARILLAFGLAFGVIGTLGVVSWKGTGATIANVRASEESDRETRLLDDLLRALTEADRASREFIYSGNVDVLGGFHAARLRAGRDLDSLAASMRSEADEAATLAKVVPLVTAKFEFSAATIAARQGRGGDRAAYELITTGRGWQLSGAIQEHLAAMQAHESVELRERAAALEGSAVAARTIVTVTTIVTLLILGLGGVGILREVEARARTQRELASNGALLREAYDELADLYDHAPCGYHSIDADGTILRINDTELAWLGYERSEVVGRLRISDLLTPASVETFNSLFPGYLEKGDVHDVEIEFVRKDGSSYAGLLSSTAIRDAEGRFIRSRTVVLDMTQLRKAQDETLRVVSDLAEALNSVKTLTGLLPICSMCHNVRDDKGYWATVEQYVSAHTDAKFSHGVCPDCFPKMFPGVELNATEG